MATPQSITLIRSTGMVEFKVPITPFEHWTVKTAFDTGHDDQVRASLIMGSLVYEPCIRKEVGCCTLDIPITLGRRPL